MLNWSCNGFKALCFSLISLSILVMMSFRSSLILCPMVSIHVWLASFLKLQYQVFLVSLVEHAGSDFYVCSYKLFVSYVTL